MAGAALQRDAEGDPQRNELAGSELKNSITTNCGELHELHCSSSAMRREIQTSVLVRQVNWLMSRFRLPPSVAGLVASLAFGEGAR
jgi:hypothetical protein